jgi:hypothetical protein
MERAAAGRSGSARFQAPRGVSRWVDLRSGRGDRRGSGRPGRSAGRVRGDLLTRGQEPHPPPHVDRG